MISSSHSLTYLSLENNFSAKMMSQCVFAGQFDMVAFNEQATELDSYLGNFQSDGLGLNILSSNCKENSELQGR